MTSLPMGERMRDHGRTGPRFGGRVRSWVRVLYVRLLRPRIGEPLHRQRVKLVSWDAWGYWRLLVFGKLPLTERFRLVISFLRIDWHVPHAHKPHEMSWLFLSLSERRAYPGEIVVEAGCWRGGSSSKFSLMCELLGYELHIFDSFQGVEPRAAEDRSAEYDFSFEYSSPESVLRRHLDLYGRPAVCHIHRGWFVDTLAARPLSLPVRLVYIDCDIAKGTREVLVGVLPALVPDGCIFSQDLQIAPVRAYLTDAASWRALGVRKPSIRELGPCLARIQFPVTPPRHANGT